MSRMKNRLFILLMSMAVVFSTASGAVCASLSAKADRTACEKTRHSWDGLNKTDDGKCHVTPCHAHKGKVLLLPDASHRLSRDDSRHSFANPGPGNIAKSIADALHLRSGRHINKFPSTLYPPPLFSLNCAYLC